MQIGIVGFGAIGQDVAAGLEKGTPDVELAAITGRDLDKARRQAQALVRRVPPVVPLDDTVRRGDLIVETAPRRRWGRSSRWS